MYEYRCVITRIVDGDTVDVNIDLGFDVWLSNQRVRLYGIDAPESRTSDEVEEHFGELSEQFVKQKLGIGESVKLVSKDYSPSSGKYGRVLGDFMVYDDQTDSWQLLTQVMIREGHAVVYRDGDEKYLMKKDHLENRRKLITEGKSTLTLEQAGVK